MYVIELNLMTRIERVSKQILMELLGGKFECEAMPLNGRII